MTDQVPEAAGQLAARLADAFEQDHGLAEQLTAAQHRLQAANDRLSRGFIPTRSGCSMTTPPGAGSVRAQARSLDSWSTRCAQVSRRLRSRRRCCPRCRRPIGRFTARSQSTSRSPRTAGISRRRSAS